MRNLNRTLGLWFFLILACLPVISPIIAQTTNTSDLLGVVRDPQGLGIPEAEVTATEVSKGYESRARTESDGFFRIKGVLPGTYRVAVTAPGFQSYVDERVIVYTRQERRIDINLVLGQTSQQVTVQGEGSVINTETATQATSLSEAEIREFPVGFRGGVAGSPM
jgi:hypothetical protein